MAEMGWPGSIKLIPERNILYTHVAHHGRCTLNTALSLLFRLCLIFFFVWFDLFYMTPSPSSLYLDLARPANLKNLARQLLIASQNWPRRPISLDECQLQFRAEDVER